MTTLQLRRPRSIITQGFGENANNLYASQGLKGHTGIDFSMSYGLPIQSFVDSYCYSVMNRNNPNLMAYRAVFTLVDIGDVTYEVSYGHCSTISAQPRTSVSTGSILGAIGNTGSVYQNGVEVTKNAKDSGSHAGSHLHFQVRKVKRVSISIATKPMMNPYKHYLMDGFGIFSLDGCYYEILEYNNGYNGCVDPSPFFVGFLDTLAPPTIGFKFNNNLWIGQKNNDVLELQKRLNVLQTGFFWTATFSAVRAYQISKGIGATGFVGPLTRAALNSMP